MAEDRLVLLIDRDRESSASIATALAMSGKYTVTEVLSAADAEHVLASAKTEFQAILMNIGHGGRDGIEACARFRHHYADIVIILLSVSDDEMVLVHGLQAGADDFIRKPFRSTEVLARLETRLRHLTTTPGAAITIGRFSFDPGKRLLLDEGGNTRIRLAEKEAKLLWHLYLGNGGVVSRVSLLHAVWGYSRTATSHTVETHVYRLRQKIEADPSRPAMVLTERGGYRLSGDKRDGLMTSSPPRRPYFTRAAV